MKKHFVTYRSPGTFVAEETTREIESWDTAKAVDMAHDIVERHNATPYGFYFTTRTRADDDFDSRESERSGFFFLGGKIETLAEIEARNDPSDWILICNMNGNGYDIVLVNTNSWKSVHPIENGDVVLPFVPKPKAGAA